MNRNTIPVGRNSRSTSSVFLMLARSTRVWKRSTAHHTSLCDIYVRRDVYGRGKSCDVPDPGYIPDLSDLPCLQVARAQHGEWMEHG